MVHLLSSSIIYIWRKIQLKIVNGFKKPDFLKSGQITIGQNKVFCGADNSIITLQSAEGGTLNAIKLIDANFPNISKPFTGSPSTLGSASWENLPSDFINHWYRNLLVVQTYDLTVRFTGTTYARIYYLVTGDGRNDPTSFGDANTGDDFYRTLGEFRKMYLIDGVDVSDDRIRYTYHARNEGSTISISNSMNNLYLTFYIDKNISYTCTGSFRHTVYGIL